MCDGRNTLCNNTVDEEEEEEAKDDEEKPPSALYQKNPLASCHTYSEMMTKHNYQKYTAYLCKTQ